MALVGDALGLLGVLVTYPVSRRPVRPLADEPMRSLPGGELVAGAKIRWNHAVTVLGDEAGQMPWAFVLEPAGETSTRLITRSGGTTGRLALGLMLKVFWHPPGRCSPSSDSWRQHDGALRGHRDPRGY